MNPVRFVRPWASEELRPASPGWDELLAGTRASAGHRLVLRPPGIAEAAWTRALHTEAEAVGPGGSLLVSWDRRRLSRQRSGSARAWIPPGPSGLSQVTSTLERCGLQVRAVYRLWPRAGAPRVAVTSFGAFRWMQRSGVLGGGGRWLLMRSLARSALVTRVAWLGSPAFAVLAGRLGTEAERAG